MLEAVSASETSVNLYETKWKNASNYSHLHTRRLENIKFHYSVVIVIVKGV
jgi:hypothetical protein